MKLRKLLIHIKRDCQQAQRAIDQLKTAGPWRRRSKESTLRFRVRPGQFQAAMPRKR